MGHSIGPGRRCASSRPNFSRGEFSYSFFPGSRADMQEQLTGQPRFQASFGRGVRSFIPTAHARTTRDGMHPAIQAVFARTLRRQVLPPSHPWTTRLYPRGGGEQPPFASHTMWFKVQALRQAMRIHVVIKRPYRQHMSFISYYHLRHTERRSPNPGNIRSPSIFDYLSHSWKMTSLGFN